MGVDQGLVESMLHGHRHGVIVTHEDGVWSASARTRRGARKRYLDALDWLALHPEQAHALPGDELLLLRVERGRVVDRLTLRAPGDAPPDGGVREPRRPWPSAGGAAAAVEPPL